MGLFDKMFGQGAQKAAEQPKAEERFKELKQKYQTVLITADQQRVEFQNLQCRNLHVQDNKLFIKGTAPTEAAKSKFWDQVKLVSPNQDDITADITVDSSRAAGAAVGGAQGGQTYTVNPGTRSPRSASSSMETRMSTCASSTRIATSSMIPTRFRLGSN